MVLRYCKPNSDPRASNLKEIMLLSHLIGKFM